MILDNVIVVLVLALAVVCWSRSVWRIRLAVMVFVVGGFAWWIDRWQGGVAGALGICVVLALMISHAKQLVTFV